MSDYKDHLGRPIVAVTGLGIVSSLGAGKIANWERLTNGESGIKPVTRFSTDKFSTTISGMVDFVESDNALDTTITYPLAETAASEALEEAGFGGKSFEGPLFLAAPPVEIHWNQRLALDAGSNDTSKDAYSRLLDAAKNAPIDGAFESTQFGDIADRLADAFDVDGVPVTLSTACASGATAIQLGVEAIRRGECDRALAIGADGSTSSEAMVRFSLLSALSTNNEPPEQASRPFSKDRSGFVMAEGAGALVLESLESAMARGADIIGILKGCGEKADHFHRTRSSPDGAPAIGAVKAALEDADLGIDSIDYINAHGTSTPENDKMEAMSLGTVFGERMSSIPISSNKSMIGHTLSAAGAIEAVFSLLAIKHGILPPTINYETPDPLIPLDVVPNSARKADVAAVLSNSFGFGGQNTCLVMTRHKA